MNTDNVIENIDQDVQEIGELAGIQPSDVTAEPANTDFFVENIDKNVKAIAETLDVTPYEVEADPANTDFFVENIAKNVDLIKDNFSGGGGGGVGIPLSVSQTGVLTRSTDSFVFTTPPEATRIEYDGSKGLYGLRYAFYECQGLTRLDLSSVTEVIDSDALSRCFYSCRNLVSVDFSGLKTINGSSALECAFQYCSALASVDFSSLRRVTSSRAMYKAFERCTSLSSLSFPSFDASVSQDYSLNGMLSKVTGCTVHFPTSQQSTMSSWSSVTNGFGGTNTTVLFDL